MNITTPKEASPGTAGERLRWERPPENRPRGYLQSLDDPIRDGDARGHAEAEDEGGTRSSRRRDAREERRS